MALARACSSEGETQLWERVLKVQNGGERERRKEERQNNTRSFGKKPKLFVFFSKYASARRQHLLEGSPTLAIYGCARGRTTRTANGCARYAARSARRRVFADSDHTSLDGRR